MNMDDKIKRINELFKKMKAEGLSEAEQQEQQNLRRDYIEAMKRSVKHQLDSVRVVGKDQEH